MRTELEHHNDDARRALFKQLNERELAVLKLLSDGKQLSDICELLSLTMGVTKQVSFSIKNKIGATTMTGVVAMAIRLGVIQ